jgi:hypothetical protein
MGAALTRRVPLPLGEHRALFALASLALLLSACGGSGGSPSGGSPVATPTPGAPSAGNPCTAALAATGGVAASSGATPAPKHDGFGHDDRHPRDLLALHLLPRGDGVSARALAPAAVRSGDIAVLSDDGSLVVGANPFDLGGSVLRFDPNGQGGYDVRRGAGALRADLGRRLRLADDDTSEEGIPFAFPLYGAARTSAYVNSDGNLTFGEGDVATDARSLGRLLAGAPRVAPFFADLDPAKGGGIFVGAASDAFTVTWCEVPDFDDTGKVTAQASLLAGGSIEIRIDASTTLKEAVVALSPGATGAFAAVDLSAATASAPGGASAVGERFAAQASLDLVAAARGFYAGFGDAYDQLVFFTDTRVTEPGTFAFESTVRNAVSGIGQELIDVGGAYGSASRLASVVLMDDLGKYPANPIENVNGDNTTLSLLAHETGHRWGATLRFRDASGARSDALLGRQLAHWSFFFDSDASVLEGNDIEDRGGGSFRTVGTSQRYNAFDLYAMGLLAEGEVPPSFYVESPSGTGQRPDSAPRNNVSFTGTRRDVAIADVVAAMGRRDPPASRAPRVHRQAFVYVVSAGRSADPAALAKLEGFRRAFEPFFASATGGRMVLETRLD